MNFTDLFIRRPVMTVLLNIAIVLAGLVALPKNHYGKVLKTALRERLAQAPG